METPTIVEVEDRSTVRLSWASGVVQQLSASALRAACACADCLTDTARTAIRLTVVGAEPSIEDAALVGDYGIAFVFGPDGHRTGIFRWDQLAELGRSPAGSD